MSIDPFAQFEQSQAPSQPAQATPVQPPAPDLTHAPEVAAHPAPTAAEGGSARQRRSEAEKARAALETATRKVESLRKRRDKAQTDAQRFEMELQAAQSRADYLAQHPALQDVVTDDSDA